MTDRVKCYKCYRPSSSCMCEHIHKIPTKTKFIILMHPKEYKKIKNTTGHLTNLSLPNSELFVGIDFTNHRVVNEIIDAYDSFILYPSDDAINLSINHPYEKEHQRKKAMAVFIIDSTWACSIKMLRESRNLRALKCISFSNTKLSEFKIKKQPKDYCLSTIESTLTLLKLLNRWRIEDIKEDDFNNFLNPFHKMVQYQLKHIQNPLANSIRFKKKRKLND